MANWRRITITKKGLALQAKSEAGAILNITKFAIGSGTPTDLANATALQSKKLDMGIVSKVVKGDVCTIYATATNEQIATGFSATELGIYAQDPQEGEILYAITTDANPDNIPASSSGTVITTRIGVSINFSNAANVAITIQPGAFITAGDLTNAIKDAVTQHKNASPLDHPDGSVTYEKLADRSVGTDKIRDKNISERTMGDNAVSTRTIIDRSVTRNKLAEEIYNRSEIQGLLSALEVIPKLRKETLAQLGVKYSLGDNGYVCFGELFGGVILQWGVGYFVNSKTATQALPIAFTKDYKVICSDAVDGEMDSSGVSQNVVWNRNPSNNSTMRFVANDLYGGVFCWLAIGK